MIFASSENFFQTKNT